MFLIVSDFLGYAEGLIELHRLAAPSGFPHAIDSFGFPRSSSLSLWRPHM